MILFIAGIHRPGDLLFLKGIKRPYNLLGTYYDVRPDKDSISGKNMVLRVARLTKGWR